MRRPRTGRHRRRKNERAALHQAAFGVATGLNTYEQERVRPALVKLWWVWRVGFLLHVVELAVIAYLLWGRA